MWRTEEEREIHQSEGGIYPMTEPVSVPSSIYSAGQQADPIIAHTVKPSHGVKRGRERGRENNLHVIHSK